MKAPSGHWQRPTTGDTAPVHRASRTPASSAPREVAVRLRPRLEWGSHPGLGPWCGRNEGGRGIQVHIAAGACLRRSWVCLPISLHVLHQFWRWKSYIGLLRVTCLGNMPTGQANLNRHLLLRRPSSVTIPESWQESWHTKQFNQSIKFKITHIITT